MSQSQSEEEPYDYICIVKVDNVSLSLANADVLSHVIGHNCCLAEWTCVIKERELARKSKPPVFGLLFCLFIVFAGVTRACGERWGSRTNRNKGCVFNTSVKRGLDVYECTKTTFRFFATGRTGFRRRGWSGWP